MELIIFDNIIVIKKDEIKLIKNFNIQTINEALRQAEMRLNDSFSKKGVLEKRAQGFLSVSIAILTFLSSVLNSSMKQKINTSNIIFILGILCIILGIIFLALSLQSNTYGTLGRYPEI